MKFFNSKEKHIPTAIEACACLAVFGLLIVVSLKAGIGNQMMLFFAASFAMFLTFLFRVPWAEVEKSFTQVLTGALPILIILMLVGIIVGAWIVGGTIPTMMYYGLRLCTPTTVLPIAFIICSITSICTGTSFGSMATMGIAMSGVATSLGVPLPVVVGAIVSGAFFGDKLSPLSDSTNLAASQSGVDTYRHVGSMLYTTIPVAVVCFILYAILGLQYSNLSMDSSAVSQMMEALRSNFTISPLALIPAVLVLTVSLVHIPAILGLFFCALFSIAFAMLFQNVDFATVMFACASGYTANTGLAILDPILSKGGLSSMMGTISLIMLASVMGGTIKASGCIDTFVDRILMRFIHNEKSLVFSTMVYCYLVNMITGSQPVAIVMGGTTFREIYDHMNVDRRVLSRSVEDSATVGHAIIPWSLGAAYITGLFGVGIEYIPYTFLSYITPIFSAVCAITGIAMWDSAGKSLRGNRNSQV